MYLWQIMRCHVPWTVIYFKLRHPCMVRVCLWTLLYRYMQCRYLWYELRYEHLYWPKVTFIMKVCVISKPNVNHVRTAVFHYLYTIRISLWTPYTWYGSDGRIGPAKMAASATTTRNSHISVIFLHGSVAGSGSCCASCMTSHGWRVQEGSVGREGRVSAAHGIVGRVRMWERGIGKKGARKWKGKKMSAE
jgi:hypothetical protein